VPRSPHRSSARRLAGLGAAALLSVSFAGCTSPAAEPVAAAPPSAAPGTANCAYPTSGDPARTVEPPPTTGVPATGKVRYTLALSGGPVTLTLDRAKAPCTVGSFASLADQGYFDKTRCHRLVDSGIFVLQCGDPTGSGSGGPGYTFADETTGSESYTSGLVAMANRGPDTNGSQFFLIWDDSTAVLDKIPNYTIFGTMDRRSRDVVAEMAHEGQDGTNPSGGGRPNNPSEISTVTRG